MEGIKGINLLKEFDRILLEWSKIKDDTCLDGTHLKAVYERQYKDSYKKLETYIIDLEQQVNNSVSEKIKNMFKGEYVDEKEIESPY